MTTPQRYTLALVQMSCGAEPAENLAKAVERIRAAGKAGAAVVCLPELFRTRYFCQREEIAAFDLAEPVPGPTTAALAAAAREAGVAVVTSVFEKRAPGLHHNTAVILDADGALRGIYRKMHIPHDPLYYEKYYFTPGDTGFRAFDVRPGRIGALVCWDQWYPEAARLTALQGAQLLLYPTAIGWHPQERARYGDEQHQAWLTVQRAHAISNGVYVAACNRVGHEGPAEGGLQFWGGSFVADPFGVVLAQASHEREEAVYAEVDPERIEDVRRNWPFLRDRRVDAYGPIVQRIID